MKRDEQAARSFFTEPEVRANRLLGVCCASPLKPQKIAGQVIF
jgi:hypothetical protein